MLNEDAKGKVIDRKFIQKNSLFISASETFAAQRSALRLAAAALTNERNQQELTHILKLTSDLSFSAVTKLANEMVQKSTFPDELKLADVSPVFKIGDTVLKNNYRPIRVLSSLSKVSERLLLKQFQPFIGKRL